MTVNATNNAYFDDILKTDSSLAKDEINESNQENFSDGCNLGLPPKSRGVIAPIAFL